MHLRLATAAAIVAAPAAAASITFTSAERIVEASPEERFVSNDLGPFSAVRDDIFDLGSDGFLFVEAEQTSDLVDLAGLGAALFATGGVFANLETDGEALSNDAFSFLAASFTVDVPTTIRVDWEVVADPTDAGTTNAIVDISTSAGVALLRETADGGPGVGGAAVGSDDLVLAPGTYALTATAGIVHAVEEDLVAAETSRASFDLGLTIVPAPSTLAALLPALGGVRRRRR